MNPALVKAQIANLRMSHPELAADEEAWLLSLESETSLDELLRAIERKRQETEAAMAGIDWNIDTLRQRRDRFEHREKSLRGLMFQLMQSAEVQKRELPEATLSVRRVPPKVLIIDEAALPDIACKFIRKPDLARIKELLTDDDIGKCAGAAMSNGSETLSIRTK